MKKTVSFLGDYIPLLRRISSFFKLITLIIAVSILNTRAGISKEENKNVPAASEMQQITVSGTVTDAGTNEPMPGVNIQVRGTTIGTITDAVGKFSFAVSDRNAVLVFSFIGYVTQEIPIGGRSVVDIALAAELTGLDEVIVIGYGTQKRTSVTASISSIQGDQLSNIPVTNLTQTMSGSLTGVITRQTSGEPGKDQANIYIRGISSTGSTQPLLIVDGIPRDFSNLDPSTIESITILKDAAASAPYGVAGANGVVLVTTKVGKTGLPSLSFSSSFGIQNPTSLPEFPSGYEYALLKNAASANAGLPPVYTEDELQKFLDGSDPDRYANTNANDLIERNTPISNNRIEISGGAERIRYFASLGYMHQAGIFTVTYSNRFNVTANLDADVSNTTNISLKINGMQQTNTYAGETTSKIFEQFKYALPTIPMFFSNGKPATYFWPSIYDSGKTTKKTSQIFTQISIDQKIPFVPGLSLKGTVGYDPTTVWDKAWITPQHMWTVDYSTTPYTFRESIFGQTKPSLSETATQRNQYIYQASINYAKTLGRSNIGFLVLGEAKSNASNYITAERINYELSVDELALGSSNKNDASNTGSSSQARQMGLVYRLTYDFGGKYLFEGSGRYDGSYYFAPGKRWGFFPAFSVGWRLSQEGFIKNNLPWINNLKIRGSYGEVGALAGSAYQFMSSYNVGGTSNVYAIDGNVVQTATERPEPNVNITWERAQKTNIGFESSFWKELLSIEADYFFEKRSNMLTNPTVIVPLEYGIDLSQINAGKMNNQGVEVSLGSRYSPTTDLHLSFKGNLTFARNKLIETFETASTYNNPNRRTTGRPLGTQFGYKALGYWLPEDFTDPENGVLKPGTPTPPSGKVYPGDLKYWDANDDGKITVDDYCVIGKPVIPEIVYGIVLGANYKSFSLNATFQGTGPRNFNMNGYAIQPFSVGRGANKNNADYWRPDNLDAKFPRITPQPTANNTQTSSWWMYDAQYLRLKNLQVSYSLPANLIQKLGMKAAMVFVSGTNLITWTKMEYYDPEVNTSSIGYPHEKVVTLGLNVTIR